MSDYKFNCPHCNQSLEAPEDMLGETLDCPSCGGQIALPAPERPAPAPPSPPARQTRACPFCGEQILKTAVKCKHCGEFLDGRARQPAEPQHRGRQCPYCGAYGVGKVRGLQGGGEVLLAIVLFFLWIIPGIIYYIYIESVPYCSECGKRVHK